MTKTPAAREPRHASDANDVRDRVLDADFAAFMKHGFATASALESANRQTGSRGQHGISANASRTSRGDATGRRPAPA